MNISLTLFLIFSLGKKYPWKKTDKCPRCSSTRLWGHGFVRRYFFQFSLPFWIKRYRCPECSTVITMRPDGLYPRFQYPESVIIKCLLFFVKNKKISTLVSRQLQQYWIKGALIQINRFTNSNELTLENLQFLFSKEIIISTHSLKKSSIYSANNSPHRFFAVTDDFTFT